MERDKAHTSLKDDFRKIAPAWGIVIVTLTISILLLSFFNLNIINYIQYPPNNPVLMSRALYEEGMKYYRNILDKAQKIRAEGRSPELKGDPDLVHARELFLKSLDLFEGEKNVYQRLATLAELEGDIPGTYYYQGRVLINAGQLDEALVKFDNALELNPNYANVMAAKAWALLLNERLEEAEQVVTRLLEVAPEVAEGHFLAGRLALERRDSAAALDELGKAVDLTPGYLEAALLYSQVLDAQQRSDEAISVLKRAEPVNPNNARLKHRIARILASQGKLEESFKYLLRAEKLEKNSDSLYLDLARVAHQLGKERRATIYLSRALDLNPSLKEKTLTIDLP